MCTCTPLLYFTRPYPNPRRTMSAVLIVGLVQYAQVQVLKGVLVIGYFLHSGYFEISYDQVPGTCVEY